MRETFHRVITLIDTSLSGDVISYAADLLNSSGTKRICTHDALRILPKDLHRKAQVTLARLGAVTSIQDLREICGNHFKALGGDRKGQCSIRIKDQYRICFRWKRENAIDVEIVDYH